MPSQEGPRDLGDGEPCLGHLLAGVRQEMAIVMLEGLQRSADACAEICMRAVQEERQKFKIHMAQEELLFALRDEHQRCLGALKNGRDVLQPAEAKVFNLDAEEDIYPQIPSPTASVPRLIALDAEDGACSKVTCPSYSHDGSNHSMWDMSWSSVASRTLGPEVDSHGVEVQVDAIGHEVGVQVESDAHEVGVQVSKDTSIVEVGVQVPVNPSGCKVGVQKSERVDGDEREEDEAKEENEDGPVSSLSSFGMVFEAQAKLQEVDELIRRALNVPETELGLSKLPMTVLGHPEDFDILPADHQTPRDTTGHDSPLDRNESPFTKFQDALKKSRATHSEPSNYINVEEDVINIETETQHRRTPPSQGQRRRRKSESSELRWSDDEAWSPARPGQPGEEPSPNDSGEDDDLSVIVAEIEKRYKTMQPTRANGWRTLNIESAPTQKEKPSPSRSVHARSSASRSSRPERPFFWELDARREVPIRFKKYEPQCDSETDSAYTADPARLRGPFRKGRGSLGSDVGVVRHGSFSRPESNRRQSAV